MLALAALSVGAALILECSKRGIGGKYSRVSPYEKIPDGRSKWAGPRPQGGGHSTFKIQRPYSTVQLYSVQLNIINQG